MNAHSLRISDLGPLSPKQARVLQLVAEGKENKEIAREENCSPRTVKAHIEASCLKLEARNRTAAVTEAFRRGVLTFALLLPVMAVELNTLAAVNQPADQDSNSQEAARLRRLKDRRRRKDDILEIELDLEAIA